VVAVEGSQPRWVRFTGTCRPPRSAPGKYGYATPVAGVRCARSPVGAASSLRLRRYSTWPLAASMTCCAGCAADIVIVDHACRRPVGVRNSTALARSALPGVADFSFRSVRAARIASAAVLTALRAALAGAAEAATGEPWTAISAPSRATCALMPLPNTSVPSRVCTNDRWWMPAMSA